MDLDSYANPSAFFYLTIVGALFVPGNHHDALCLIEGILYDVRNEFIYLTVESEGKGSTYGPPAFVDYKVATRRAMTNAMDSLGPVFIRHISNLKGKDPAKPAKSSTNN